MTKNIKIGHMERSVFYCPSGLLDCGRADTHRKSPIWLQRIIYTQPHYHPSHVYYTSYLLMIDYKSHDALTIGWGNINSFLPHTIWIGYTHWIFCGSAGTACKWVRKQHPINEQSETEFKWLKLHFMWCHYMPVVIGKDKTCFRSAHCVFACLLIQQNNVSRGKMNKPNPNPNCLSVTIRLKLLRF